MKEEVSDKCFFDHLKDENSEEAHGEREKYEHSDKGHGQRDNCSVKLDCNVFAESGAASPEQYVTTQLAKDDSSNIPMFLRKPPP
jgi:hypothetical protein